MKTYLASLLLAVSSMAGAADFDPTKNAITIVAPTAPGGPTDGSARILSEYLGQKGYNVGVSNRPGNNRITGVNSVATQTGNNYTLLMGAFSDTAVSPLLKPQGIQYDENTLTPIAVIGENNAVFITSKTTLKSQTVKEFLNEYKSNSNKITFGTIGAAGQLAIHELVKGTGIEPVIINYKSAPAAAIDVVAGVIQVGYVDGGTATALINDGRVHGLAVAKNARIPELPNVPSVAETIPGYNYKFWFCVFGGPGMDPKAVTFYNKMINDMIKDPVYLEKLHKIQIAAQPNSVEEAKSFYRGQVDMVRPLVHLIK